MWLYQVSVVMDILFYANCRLHLQRLELDYGLGLKLVDLMLRLVDLLSDDASCCKVEHFLFISTPFLLVLGQELHHLLNTLLHMVF